MALNRNAEERKRTARISLGVAWTGYAKVLSRLAMAEKRIAMDMFWTD